MRPEEMHRIRPTIIMCHQSRRSKRMPCALCNSFRQIFAPKSALASHSISTRQRLHRTREPTTTFAKSNSEVKYIFMRAECGHQQGDSLADDDDELLFAGVSSALSCRQTPKDERLAYPPRMGIYQWQETSPFSLAPFLSLSLSFCVSVCACPQTHKRNLLEKPELKHAY